MSATLILDLVVIVVLLFWTAFLSAAETVLLRLAVVRAMRLREESAKGSERLVWLVEHRSRALSVILLLTVTVRIVVTVLVMALLLGPLGTPGAAAATAVILVLVSYVLTEVAPRTLTLRRLEWVGLHVGPFASLLTRMFGGVAGVLVGLGRSVGRSRQEVSGPYPTEDELRELLAAEDDDEELEDDERAMIHSIFELGETIVREIMTPRPDMVVVGADATLPEVVDIVIESGYSRIPVFQDDRDELTGMVYAKDVLERVARHPGLERWVDLVRDVPYVPETKEVDALLRELQEQKVHLAIVIDEYGGMSGLVTIEDILEEIVGEIVDEHDREEALIEVVDETTLRLDARLPVDDLNELLSTDLPGEGWDSVGGLVLGMLGRVPEAGEEVTIEGITFVAERVQGRRVNKVTVQRRPVPEPEIEEAVT